MSASKREDSARPRPTVFLSYASEDRAAAQRIRDALPGYGMEVWYDESDLVGGDAWDQKIRGQIRACDYFMPVISAHTEARHEGYFRREWRLAVERTLDMADDHVFLLPVVIDATGETGARVPERFRAVQWLRVPDGRPTAGLEALCRRLVSGATPQPSPAAPPSPGPPPAERTLARRGGELPPFPHETPGQRTRFWFQVAGWLGQCAWVLFKRLPKWVRVLVYIWAAIFLIARGCSSPDVPQEHRTTGITPAQEEQLKEIAASHPGGWTPAETARLIAQIATEVPAISGDASPARAAVLTIPFAAPAGDAAAQRLTGSVFTQVYGRLAIARHGHVALADAPLPTLDSAAAVEQGRAHHSTYVVEGAVAGNTPDQQLTIKVVSVGDGATVWSKSYRLAGADAAAIAAEVSARVPRREDD
jgi:TolB-like protein